MGCAISVHKNDTASRPESGFPLIYSRVPCASVALQQELYFLSSMEHIILYMLHKSSYHPSKANRGYIYFSYLVGLVHEGAAGRRWRVIHKVKQTWLWVFHYCLWLTMRPLHSGPENTLSISIWKDCCEDQWEYASIHINMHINTHKHAYKHTQASTVYVNFL